MDNTKYINVLSLCTGYGGLELGLHRAMGRPLRVVAVEIEAFAEANLVAKAEEGKLAIEAVYPDLKTFPAERFSGCFDFILAGYPCQPFSVAGKRKGKEDPRHLWPYISDIISAVKPTYGFFENVAGHLTSGFPEVYRSLRNMGYSVEAGLFTAIECGLDIESKRLFILASSMRDGCEHVCCSEPSSFVKSREILARGRGQRPAKRLGSSLFSSESDERESNPRVCRGANEPAWQVDELRLLGNGVVPQQAELAIDYLLGQIQ